MEMDRLIEKAFRELLPETIFYAWSDHVFGSRTPQWIECVKIDEERGQEIEGCLFYVDPAFEVYILV